jgi:hypothetical protein
MLTQEVMNWLMFGFGAAVSGIVKNIWASVKELQRDNRALAEKLSAVQILVVGDYVKKPDFDKVVDRLFVRLGSIQESLAEKQNRSE